MLGADIPLGDVFKLACGAPVPGFIALNRPLRRGKRPTSPPRIDAAFHPPLLLFHQILYLFTVAKSPRLWEGAVVLEGVERPWGRGVLVDGEHTRGECM